MHPKPHLHNDGDPFADLSDNGNQAGDGAMDPANPTFAFWSGDASGSQINPSDQETGASVVAGDSIIIGHAGAGLTIIANLDSSITSLQTTNLTLYNGIVAALNTAVQFYENQFTNPVTITLNFGYNEVAGNPIAPNGAVGMSSANLNFFTWAQIYAAANATLNGPGTTAIQHAAFPALPSTDPTNGGEFAVNFAQQLALGLATPTGVDGSVGLSSSYTYDFTQSNTNSNGLDAVSVFEHEISEVLGRSDLLGTMPFGDGKAAYTLLDFFHYSAAGAAPNAAPGTLAGPLDEPFVAGYSASTQGYFSYNGQTITLPYGTLAEILQGDDVADWSTAVTNDSYGFSPLTGTAPVSTTDLEEMSVIGWDVACFLPGTQIATASGEVAVEQLKVGDLVLTLRGEAKAITWIGQGKGLATRGSRSAITPVIVRKGAIADNVPNRDLRITKGHSLCVDGVLIPAEYLVNHRSIEWDDRAQEVEVYHIELTTHDVLLANGTPAESYRDDGNRWMFQNAKGDRDQPVQAPCAPVLTGGPVVDAIWRRLLDRSGSRPGMPLTDAADVHLMVDDTRIDGRRHPDSRYLFRIAKPEMTVRIVSRAAAPDELGLARDPRVLGVAVRKIAVWNRSYPILVTADDQRLSNGFHPYEVNNDWRWTNGDALLPLALFDHAGVGSIDIELYVESSAKYPLLADPSGVAA